MSKEAPAKTPPKPRGRPATGGSKKKPKPPPLEKKGVVSSPDNPANQIEFAYDTPAVFKNMFKFFTSMKTVHIHIRFSPAGISFFIRDLLQKCRVVAHLPGANANWYYCTSTVWVGLLRAKVAPIFSRIDSSIHKVSIIKKFDDDEHIEIILKDMITDKDCNYKIAVSNFDKDDDLLATEGLVVEDALEKHPVAFTLQSALVKKTVGDVGSFSDFMTIEKIGLFPLRITYTIQGLTYNETYRDPKKIDLKSNVKSDEVFRVIMLKESLKALSGALISPDVRIYCKEGAPMIFISELDALKVYAVVEAEP